MNKKASQKATVLLEAVATLNSFSTIVVEGTTILLDDIYKLLDDSEKNVTFSLMFYNIGVSTTTNASLENIIIFPDEQGSINEFAIGKNNALLGKELSIVSNIVATTLTASSLPIDFKAVLVLKGGKATVKFSIQNLIKLENVGDQVNLQLTLFFY